MKKPDQVTNSLLLDCSFDCVQFFILNHDVHSPRGDGFPLASMLVLVSVEQKELVPIFAAHVYTVCPTVIPTLPRMASLANDDEEALQKSLGMAKSKTGEYETFERFLTRTEVRAPISAVCAKYTTCFTDIQLKFSLMCQPFRALFRWWQISCRRNRLSMFSWEATRVPWNGWTDFSISCRRPLHHRYHLLQLLY
jgi:hypothetical protein